MELTEERKTHRAKMEAAYARETAFTSNIIFELIRHNDERIAHVFKENNIRDNVDRFSADQRDGITVACAFGMYAREVAWVAKNASSDWLVIANNQSTTQTLNRLLRDEGKDPAQFDIYNSDEFGPMLKETFVLGQRCPKKYERIVILNPLFSFQNIDVLQFYAYFSLDELVTKTRYLFLG